MADPIRISIAFDATGEVVIRRVEANLAGLVTRVNAVNATLAKAAPLRQLQADLNRFNSSFTASANQAFNRVSAGFNSLTGTVRSFARISAVAFAGISVGAGIGIVAINSIVKAFVRVNEQFKGLDITLRSTFKSLSIARDLRAEIVKITAQSTTPFKDIAEFTRALSVIPFSRQQISAQASQGTLSAQDGFFRASTRLLDQITTFRPDKNAEDVTFALREAFGGEFRSLVRRFDIPLKAIAAAGNTSVSALKADPAAADKAIKAFFNNIITPQAVQELLRQPTKLIQQVLEQVVDIPLLKVGDSGLFKKMSDLLLGVFNRVQDFITGGFDPFAQRISDSIGKVLDILSSTVGNALESLLSKIGGGKTDLPGLSQLARISTVIAKAFEDFAASFPKFFKQVKDTVSSVYEFVSSLLGFLKRVGSLILGNLSSSPIAAAFQLFFLVKLPAIIGGFVGLFGQKLARDLPAAFSSAFARAQVFPQAPAGALFRRTVQPGLFTPGSQTFQPNTGGRLGAAVTNTLPSKFGAAIGGFGAAGGAILAGTAQFAAIAVAVAGLTYAITKLINYLEKRGIDEDNRLRELAKTNGTSALSKLTANDDDRARELIRLREELANSGSTVVQQGRAAPPALSRGAFLNQQSGPGFKVNRFLDPSQDVTGAVLDKQLEALLDKRQAAVESLRSSLDVIASGDLKGDALKAKLGSTANLIGDVRQATDAVDFFITNTRKLLTAVGATFKSSKLTSQDNTELQDFARQALNLSSPEAIIKESFEKSLEGINQFTSTFKGQSGIPIQIRELASDFEDEAAKLTNPFASLLEGIKDVSKTLKFIEDRAKDVSDFSAKFNDQNTALGKRGVSDKLASLQTFDATIAGLSQARFAGQEITFQNKSQPVADVISQLQTARGDVASGKTQSDLVDASKKLLVDAAAGLRSSLSEILAAVVVREIIPNLARPDIDKASVETQLSGLSGLFSEAGGPLAQIQPELFDALRKSVLESTRVGAGAILDEIKAQESKLKAINLVDKAVGGADAIGGAGGTLTDLLPGFRKQIESLLKTLQLKLGKFVTKEAQDLFFAAGKDLDSFVSVPGGNFTKRRLDSTLGALSNPASGIALPPDLLKDLEKLGAPSIGDQNLDNLVGKYDLLIERLPKLTVFLREQARAGDELSEKYTQMADSLDLLGETAEQARRELVGTGNQFDDFATGFSGSLQRMKIEANNFTSFGADLGNSLKSNLGEALSDIASRSKTAGDAFTDFGRAVVKAMLDIAAQKVAAQIISALFSFIPSSGGVSPGDRAALNPPNRVLGNPGGPAYGKLTTARYAEGSPVGLSANNSGRRSYREEDGQTNNVTINIAVSEGKSSSDTTGNNRSTNRLGEMNRELESAVLAIMAKHSRAGGALAGLRKA